MSLNQLNVDLDELCRAEYIYELFSDEKSKINDKGEEIISASIYGYYPLNDTFGGSLGIIDFTDPNFQFDACCYQGDYDKNGSVIGELGIDRQWEFNGIKGVDFNPFTDDFNAHIFFQAYFSKSLNFNSFKCLVKKFLLHNIIKGFGSNLRSMGQV